MIKISSAIFRIKKRSPGVSLLWAMFFSIAVLGMTLFLLIQIQRTFKKTTEIEIKSQLEYAAESGFEAALFHHNARGKGISLADTGTQKTQQIALSGVLIDDWEINGRTSQNLPGVLKYGKTVSVPFFWDNAGNSKTDKTEQEISQNDIKKFNIRFSTKTFDNKGQETTTKIISESLASNFNFGGSKSQVLIDWWVTSEDGTNFVIFYPRKAKTGNCVGEFGVDRGLYCEIDFWKKEKIDFSKKIPGTIYPEDDATKDLKDDLQDFLDNTANAKKITLNFALNLPAYHVNTNNKIEKEAAGLPFLLQNENNSLEFPKHFYTITSEAYHKNLPFSFKLFHHLLERAPSKSLGSLNIE